MSSWDLVVRGGRIVTPEGVAAADLAVVEGRIAALAPNLAGTAAREIDASGRYVFPGIIDAHVHFNEPGRADWEGLETGPRALAAGGGTAFFDMPLNSEPPVTNVAAFAEKRRLAEAKSCVDFGLWGGLVPGNLDDLAPLGEAGAIGFKAFMCDSGIDSFARADPATLKRGMARVAQFGGLVAVHAEDEEMSARLTAAARARGLRSVRAWLDTRPVEVELAAIRLALELAGETRCRLQIVHVSCPEGIDLIAQARRRGVDVTAETCPHYLLLNEADMDRVGPVAKCAPPLRDEARCRELRRRVAAGEIENIGSDHSPAPAGMKASGDFFEIWGGIAGIQHGAELVLSAADPEAEWPRLSAVFSRNVARRFRLGTGKGVIAVGGEADFSIINPRAGRTIETAELVSRHRLSPYVGRTSRIGFEGTFLRGHPVWREGRLALPRISGRFLRPEIP